MSISFSKQSIGQASVLIAIFTVISQALGLVRESLIANFLGTSAEYDIILVALAIPSMIGTILMTALPSAGIPTLQNGGGAGIGTCNIFRTAFFRINLIIGLALMVIVAVSLPFLGRLLGTGIEKESVGLVLKYGYLFCLLIPIRTIEAAFQSFMHVRFHFIFPAISTIAFNIVIIGLLAGLFPALGPPIYVIAVIAGTFVEMALIGVPAYMMYRKSDSHSVSLQFSTPEYVRLLGMIALVEAIGLFVDPFDRYLAGIYLSPGYVSANYYANLVGQLPIRIVVVSLSVAIFPSLSEMAAAKDIRGLAGLYHRAIAICLLLIIPITVYSFYFRNEIISFLFERGRFNERSRELTSGVFFYYAIAMVFSSIYFIQSRVLFSLKVWRNLLWARIIGLSAKIILGILLIKEHWALAIGGGTMVMSAISAVIIEYDLYRNLNIRYTPASLKIILRALIGGIIMTPLIILMGFGLKNLIGLRSISLLAAAGVSMSLSFLIVDYFLGITGLDIKKWFRERYT
jgi:putative peptidoglycan lipid II flippase